MGLIMFSKDIKHFQTRVPRTLQSSNFGPYAQLHIPPKRYGLRGALWAIGYGIGIGVLLYVVLLVRVGS